MYRATRECRLCLNANLELVLDLGHQATTSVFPRSKSELVPSMPLHLVKCDKCHLVQLGHSYDLKLVYTPSYGYRSGLNKSMIQHLTEKVNSLLREYPPSKDDLIIDIGSNDSTLLKAYPQEEYMLVGIDPTGYKWKKYYRTNNILIENCFCFAIISKFFFENDCGDRIDHS